MRGGSRESILIAVRDPARPSQVLIRKGARLAETAGARVTLFHAFSTPYPLPQPAPATPARVLQAATRERRAELENVAKPLRAAGLAVDCEVSWDFPPAHAIVRQAVAKKATLVLAESHRRTRLARWVLANSDWELIRECPCPVWFSKSERMSRHPVVLVAVDPSHANAKPSGLDGRLLEAAAALARPLDGRVAMMHVVDVTRLAPPAFLKGLPPEELQPSEARTSQAQKALARLAKEHGFPPEAVLLETGVPSDSITSATVKTGADVLVMGAVSRSATDGDFIGNTAEAVLDDVICDVLIVKPRGFRTSVSRRRPRLK